MNLKLFTRKTEPRFQLAFIYDRDHDYRARATGHTGWVVVDWRKGGYLAHAGTGPADRLVCRILCALLSQVCRIPKA